MNTNLTDALAEAAAAADDRFGQANHLRPSAPNDRFNLAHYLNRSATDRAASWFERSALATSVALTRPAYAPSPDDRLV